jgi:anti-sigma factor RsiW
MPCGSFEDLLLDYDTLSPAGREAVDAHVSACPACREYLDVLAHIDRSLSGTFAEVEAPPVFEQQVLARVNGETRTAKPSFLPEVLDFIGWSGVIAAVAWLAWWLTVSTLEIPAEARAIAPLAGAVIAILAAGWSVVRSYAEMKR